MYEKRIRLKLAEYEKWTKLTSVNALKYILEAYYYFA